MAGDIAHKHADEFRVGQHETKVTPDRSRRLVKRFHRTATPCQIFGYQGLLNSLGERQFFINFTLARLQGRVCLTQIHLGPLAAGDINQRSFDHRGVIVIAFQKRCIFQDLDTPIFVWPQAVFKVRESFAHIQRGKERLRVFGS
jgi:hypothetical protein